MVSSPNGCESVLKWIQRKNVSIGVWAVNKYQGQFSLDPNIAYLNHGSFGAVPKVVAAAQRKFQELEESNPNLLFRTTLPKLHDEARSFVTGWLGVAPELFAFVPNNNRTLVVLN